MVCFGCHSIRRRSLVGNAKCTRHRFRTFFAASVLATLSVGCVNAAADWPPVSHVEHSYHFEHASSAHVELTITGIAGDPLYQLECHPRDYAGDPAFDYSGDFECRLYSLYSKDTYSTLLTDNPHPTRDWQSRGRFVAPELMGACAQDPEYGAVRNFQLRNMQIRLVLSEVSFDRVNVGSTAVPVLDEFDFEIVVRPDKTAQTEIAARVPFPEPQSLHPEDPDSFELNCEMPAGETK
jgi:hypothetical protein